MERKKHSFKLYPNDSGIEPVGHFVLVEPEPVEEVSKGGIVLTAGDATRKEQMAQTDGRVIAVGENAWADQPEPFAQPGDRVIFGRYNGLIRKQPNGKTYRLISDLEVVARLES